MNVLCYTAINPARRFPRAEEQILALDDVGAWWLDDSNDPALPWYDNILRKYRAARRMCLDFKYDALLTAESDMLIPPDALAQLVAASEANSADVAYGLYCLRHGAAVWNACVALDEESGFFLSDPLIQGNAPREWAAAQAGLPFQCYGAGFGCTLIRRNVLEVLDFRNADDATSFYVDWLFAADCNARQIKQVCVPQVRCGHITDTRTILYPDLTQPDLCRTEIL